MASTTTAAIRSTARVSRIISRPTAASTSTSKFTVIRKYASETRLSGGGGSGSEAPAIGSDEAVFGAGSRRGNEAETVMKRYTGKGFPMIPSLRHVVYPHHSYLHPGSPVRELTIPLRRKGGRNNTGQVVNRHVGGGHRQRLRLVDFRRTEGGIHDVIRIEYDPGRSAHIALIKRRDGGQDVSVEAGAVLAETIPGDSNSTTTVREEVKGGWSYILAPEGLRAGHTVVSYRSGIPKGLVDGWDQSSPSPSDPSTPQSVNPPNSDVNGGSGSGSGQGTSPAEGTSRALGLLRTLTLKPGNVLPLYLVPAGTNIHNISMSASGRFQLCRAAGSYAQVVAHHGPKGEALGGAEVLNMGGTWDSDGKLTKKMGSVLVKLQSGEVRRFEPGCVATVGSVSNKEHHSRQLGKAGRARWLGIRPIVRGVAMNACDHPHGGGRGKSKGGKHPRSVYGWLTKGKRTRRSKDKDGNKMVVSERPRGKGKN